jgi:large subunit ribosomal protein L9
VVKVAEGYGRNYLIPRKLAIEATTGNKAVIEQMKAASVRKSAKEKGSADELGKQLSGLVLEFTRKSGEHDQLFGSVTSSDIAKAMEAKGFNIDRRKIDLDVPLKTVGQFDVPVKLHREVTVNVKAIVKKDAVEDAAAPAAEEAPAEAEA